MPSVGCCAAVAQWRAAFLSEEASPVTPIVGIASNRFEESKADLIARAVEVGEHGRGSTAGHGDADARFLRRYYRGVAADDIVGRDPVDVFGAALSNRELAALRPKGTANVRVFTPTVEEHGWASGHTVVEIVTDDMPFLVDSVTSCLGRSESSIHLVIHPQLVVRRTITGELVEVLEESSSDHLPADALVESWMHVEVDRQPATRTLEQLAADLRRVLSDVREAVEDWPKMTEAALRTADEISSTPPPLPDAESSEGWELLRWLADDNFTFLGYREYDLVRHGDEDALVPRPGTGLGILRSDKSVSSSFAALPAEVRAKAREPRMLVLTKANSRSTVHRPAYLDYVGVKTFDAEGSVSGERRFLGLFTSSSYTQSVQRIPVLRRKVREVLDASGFAADSHSGKDLLEILETYPRDELFQIPVEKLLPTALAVLHLQERRQTRLFLRKDVYGRFMSCLVYLPRDRYTTDVRVEMEQILREAFGGASVDYTVRVSESVLARLHFVVRVAKHDTVPDVDEAELEQRLVDATRSWADDFADALVDQCGEEETTRLLKVYGEAFPEAYKEDFPARTAVADLRQLEALADSTTALNLYVPLGAAPGERRFKIYRAGAPVSLSLVLPVLQRMGVEVVDERPYEVERAGTPPVWIYDFGLRYDGPADAGDVKTRFQEAFAAAWAGQAESDGFNTLVLRAGLSWRQAMVLRAYAKYLRQAGSTFSQEYLEQCLVSYVPITRLLVRLFEASLDPAVPGEREELTSALVEEVEGALDSVASLDHDRILRSYLALIRATLRTSYFQPGPDGRPKAYVSFKLDSQRVLDLPAPRPKYEIWVYSPGVEGVHLRFGAVARGGLRWSDRREDFRTEILGLVKAQAVKNAVIVPVGAKGGFIVKNAKADPSDREAVLAEGIERYRTFVSALLDVTDNLVDGVVVPPSRVVRHDGDDPYLVVAADKGTASFSDIANEVSQQYGFWLGDAFASGGSEGYDHKVMGITARGAWESVKRHFRELGTNTQTEDFSVVGVGDMSGDVFGNGMLLSEHIRLLAAFDHRHIFLDPTPDTAASYAERRRLFDLPRSSWDDYNHALLSRGGGIYPRSAKSVPVSAEVRAALGIAAGASHLTPQELMKAILSAPVDLLWNGGIGTYVKASTESSADVGDKANDAIRVDGRDLRCVVVGEGGNLGCTQRGRIEAAQKGVRLNTDAIDNSAGVDTSDHEVNIKILLDGAVRAGDLTGKQRNELLASMTDDVAEHVLRDNYEQNVLLGNARVQSHSMLPVHQRFIRELEQHGELDRDLEFLPREAEINARFAAGLGLTSPEFSVLVAYSKMTLKHQLLSSGLPDEPYFRSVSRRYFPPPIQQSYGDRIDAHPLRREIVTTGVVNDMINRAGITFVYRASEETGGTAVEIARVFSVVREVFELPAFWARVEALDNVVSTVAQTALYLECRRLMDRATRWLLQARRSLVDVDVELAHFAAMPELRAMVPSLLRGVESERLQRRTAEMVALGVPEDLAQDTAAMLDAFSLLDVVELSQSSGEPPEQVGRLYYALSERFEVDRMLTRITSLPRDDRWAALARMALRYDLYGALAGLTRNVLAVTAGMTDPDERIKAWEDRNAEGLARARGTLEAISTSESFDLATLSVALRVIRTLVPSGSSS
jgi:glutamate dehydrogenase